MSAPKVPPPPPPKPTTHNGNGRHHPGAVHSNNGYASPATSSPTSSSLHLAPQQDEQVVMTPRGKTATSTIILIERKLIERIDERVHVAGGDHTGIIINKDAVKDQKSQVQPAQLQLEFRVFLVSGNTGLHSQESRTLRFWFRDWVTDTDKQAHVAQDFFRELVSPKEFPRDYVGFIKKIMKQLQRAYNEIQALEIELRILETTSAPPSRPLSFEDNQFEVVPLTPEKVLELIEQAYPNPINPEDLANDNGWSEEEVLQILVSLQSRGLIKAMEFNSFTRIHHEDTEIKVVKQMPTISSNKQPTIAIITAQYCEKLAVDSMLENKETFVRYTTVGESNVYTLGNIGAHRIVSTKLPSVGSTREAMTAAGNTTTRLLGTFQKVDYVFLVGVAGGVPHYTDYKKHVRLGDVVVSHVDLQGKAHENGHSPVSPVPNKPYVYVYNSGSENHIKTYMPKQNSLQEIARYIQQSQKRPWQEYMKDGLKHLQDRTENDFTRPSGNTDKLYMNIGNGDVIEVAHPQSGDAQSDQTDGMPISRVHLGPIGSGSGQIRSDSLRNEFAKNFNLLATDIEMSSVLDSVIGNCKDSFILVKGIADYKDGWSTKKWQNYSSLAAAAVMKSIVCAMDAPTNV